ncbi:MAG: hypothetical protein LUC17_05285 [Oscillospiraceae bacterium]|nr:hypothetical protein [Oscillospiraceae bacterium]
MNDNTIKDQEEQIRKLHDALDKSGFTVAITGAGISVAAGGVTYAGMRGGAGFGGGDIRSGDPEKMYQGFYRTFLRSMFEHGPTYSHKALAELEHEGKMQGVITTNVDCLHTMAGSQKVAEIQGSFQVNVCTQCGRRTYGYEIWNQGHMPTCEACGGMLLPFNIYSHAGILQPELEKAQQWMGRADLILIIGANGCYTHLYWDYKKRDAGIVQINPGSTYFDTVADLDIRRESDPVFEDLMRLEQPAS